MKLGLPIRTVCLLGLACSMALWMVWDMQHRPQDDDAQALLAPRVLGGTRVPPSAAQQVPRGPVVVDVSGEGGGRYALLMREPVDIPNELTDLFRPHSWVMFKKPVVEDVQVEPPRPTAPPVPYGFFGRMRDVEGKVVVYLKREGELIPAAVGKVLSGTYRIEAVTPSEVVVTYLPLAERQVIPAGPADGMNGWTRE
jgi:hypothetical protein